jgi:hypothetical protein
VVGETEKRENQYAEQVGGRDGRWEGGTEEERTRSVEGQGTRAWWEGGTEEEGTRSVEGRKEGMEQEPEQNRKEERRRIVTWKRRTGGELVQKSS